MATSLVEFSATHTSILLENTIAMINDVKLLAFLMIGVFLGFFLIRKVIYIIKGKE